MSRTVKTPVALVGYGVSGKAAEQLLLWSGIPTDQIHIFEESSAPGLSFSQFIEKTQAKTYVVSPGFPLSRPEFKTLKDSGCELTSELSLGLSYLKNEKLIGITGSYGKSTTTALINWALQKSGVQSLALGNLGRPLSDYVLSMQKGLEPSVAWIVLELSSYQLENCDGLKLTAGGITSFDPNHLDRYQNLQHYYNTKLNLLPCLDGPLVLNKNSSELFAQKDLIEKIWNKKNTLVWSSSDLKNFVDEHLEENLLLGKHQNQNISLAAEILQACGFKKILRFLKEFPGLPHRLELFHLSDGIILINDSKATSLQSVHAAVESVVEKFGSQRRVFLFLGGKDKALPWQNLSSLSKFTNVEFLFFGSCADVAEKSSKLQGKKFSQLALATDYVKTKLLPKDILLLSPGGSSLDEFKNFEERGIFFKQQFNL